MTLDFQNMMKKFQDIQKISLEKSRDFVVRAQEIASASTSSVEATDRNVSPPPDEGDSAPLLPSEYFELLSAVGITNEQRSE